MTDTSESETQHRARDAILMVTLGGFATGIALSPATLSSSQFATVDWLIACIGFAVAGVIFAFTFDWMVGVYSRAWSNWVSPYDN